jgi:hypothetical protein
MTAETLDATTITPTAQDYMRDHLWGKAAELLASQPKREVNEEFQLNICRNLAALKEYRPVIYEKLLKAGGDSRYSVGMAACGHPTVMYKAESGAVCSLSPGNQPVASLTTIFSEIKENYQAGRAMVVLGMGDGYFLKSCSLSPPKMMFQSEQSVYLLEPDTQALLACMTIHDYSGANGPIAQQRFRWFVGPEYESEVRESLMTNLFNPPPMFDISQSPRSKEIGAVVTGILEDLYQKYLRLQAEVIQHYAAMTAAGLAELFSDRPPRQPRILLITTRCSSVLQYSTQDAAAGLREIGWDARVLIEPAPFYENTALKVMDLLHEFRPDAVFQIDHLRSEWKDMFPPQLPFVCWVQDHMPHLTTAASGATITNRDFLLCGMPRMYTDRFGYPNRQLLQMPKLTRVPQRPSTTPIQGDHLAYVSSASELPEQRAAQVIGDEAADSPLRVILAKACELMTAVYAAEQSLGTIGAVDVVVKEAEALLGLTINDAELRRRVNEKLFDRLNNALYRQQALRWAKRIAEKHHLTLAIYGAGWDRHPEFALHARGAIEYGEKLEAMTRETCINLVLEPTLNISHQRLLDALVAGGFCLIRHSPSNLLFQEFLNFICEHAEESASNVEEVRRSIPETERDEFEKLMQRFEEFSVLGDPVVHVRGLMVSEILLRRPSPLPCLNEVSFGSQAEMEERIISHLNNPERRRAIAEKQRIDVESRFSYAHGMKRMAGWISGLLREEA